MTEPIVIVFEKRPRWTPELQRRFLDQHVRVRACRSTQDIQQCLDGNSRSVVVFDLSDDAADCLQFLGRCGARSCFPPVIVIGSKLTAELEWPLRELGALAVVEDRISGEELAQLCRRQFDASGATAVER